MLVKAHAVDHIGFARLLVLLAQGVEFVERELHALENSLFIVFEEVSDGLWGT